MRLFRDDNKTLVLVQTAVFTALIFAFTMLSFPLGLGLGYVHAGDAVIFVAAYFIKKKSILAAAIGSAFADLALGFVVYAFPTVIIKGLMAFIALIILRPKWQDSPKITVKMVLNQLLAFFTASMTMQILYIFYDAILITAGYMDLGSDALFVILGATLLSRLSQTAIALPLAILAVLQLRKIDKKDKQIP